MVNFEDTDGNNNNNQPKPDDLQPDADAIIIESRVKEVPALGK